MMVDVMIVPTDHELGEEAARRFLEAAQAAVAARGVFSVALAGGSSPVALHQALTQPAWSRRVPWRQVHVFFGDERSVPPSSPESNFGAAWRHLHVLPIPPMQVHRMDGETDPYVASRRYEEKLRAHFGAGVPRFDLIFLGLGGDGHVASLFPDSPALEEWERLVVATTSPRGVPRRLTLTLPVLNAARQVIFLVPQADKAAILRRVLQPREGERRQPAHLVEPVAGTVTWLLTEAAARRIKPADTDAAPAGPAGTSAVE